MPELDQDCISPPPPPAVPPIIDPDRFEDYPGFRETFLLYVPDPTANATLRGFGELMYNLILEYWDYWPDHPEGLLRASLRAAVADLRHVQGFLREWDSPDTAHGSPHEEHLAGVGGKVAVEIGAMADRLERELGSWRGEVGG
jgi:hypothetical protein